MTPEMLAAERDRLYSLAHAQAMMAEGPIPMAEFRSPEEIERDNEADMRYLLWHLMVGSHAGRIGV